MSIIRGPRPDSRFYTLDKSISEDPRLSWEARGMLIYLLGKPDHWEVSVKNLINQTRDSIRKASGRDSVRAIIGELEEAGYLTRDFARSAGGSFEGITYIVREIPEAPAPENPGTASPKPENPAPANPSPAKPAPANPHQAINDLQQSTDSSAKNEKEPLGASAPTDAGDGFELAWRVYPKRSGANPKGRAHNAWKARLSDGVSAETMLGGLARYAAYCVAGKKVGTEFVMQAVRFFGTERAYENDWTIAPEPAKGLPAKPASLSSPTTRDYRAGLKQKVDGHAF